MEAAMPSEQSAPSYRILDLTAGNRAMWFDKQNPSVTFVDIRPATGPDVVCDAGATPFEAGSFDLVVFDPPHGNLGQRSKMAERYGAITHAQLRTLISRTGRESHRVARPAALLICKWSDRDLSMRVLVELLSPWWIPLFGHAISALARRRADHFIHWACFMRNAREDR